MKCLERFNIPKIVDYETYQQAIDANNLSSFCIYVVIVLISLILSTCLYKIAVVVLYKRKIDKTYYIMFWLVSSLAIGIITIYISADIKNNLNEKIVNTPNLVYKWEPKKTFQLNQVQVELSKKIGTNMILTVRSEENDSIDLNAVFMLNRNNTIIHSSDKVKQEKLVLEQQVLTDKRFEGVLLSIEENERNFLSNLLYPNSQYKPPVRWIFYVEEKNKELLQLQEIDF